MGSSGFSSPRSECFPAGLRVLVVDDDPTWLKILEKMLKKCNYEVTTCNLAREALDLLRERKEGFDIVISDVNMPDMDGFKLLEHVGLEMDLPVIMMSVDGETSRVMKGVQHGACDYLLKPIRMKELKNIWQHVFRKKIHEVRDIEGYESLEEIHMLRNGNETSDDGFMFSGDLSLGKKRKGSYNKNDDMVCSDFSSMKKSRVVWTVDLHQKFVRAVNHIGFDKVGPKKILDMMGVSWLTRENVASHLQKYRLYLSRLQKENELKTSFGSINHSDIPSKDSSSANHCTQKIVPSENYETDAAPVHKIPTHKDVSKICEGNSKGVILSILMTESKKSLFGDVIDPPQTSISFSHSFGRADLKTEPNSQGQDPWSAESPSIQFKQEKIPHFQSNHSFDHLHDVHVNSVQPSRKEADKPIVASTTPSYGKSQTRSIGTVTKVKNTAALFSSQPQSKEFEQQIPCSLEQNLFEEFGTGSGFRLWDEEFNSFSSQGDFHPLNADIEPFGFGNKEVVISGVPQHLYDSLSFEYQNEPVEYQVIDQGLFIA